MAYSKQVAKVAASSATSATSATAWASNLTVGNFVIVAIGLSGSTNNATPTVSSVSLGTDSLSQVSGANVRNGSGSTGIYIDLWAGTVATSTQRTLTVNVSTAANIEAVGGEYDSSVYTITLSGSATTNTGSSASAATTSLTPSGAQTLRVAGFAAQNTLTGTLADNTNLINAWVSEGTGEQAGSGSGGALTGTCGVALADGLTEAAVASLPTLGLGGSVAWATSQVAFLQASSSALVSGFVGHTRANQPNASSNVVISTPAGIAVGDLMLVWITSFNTMCAAPAGWAQIGSTQIDSNTDELALFWKIYALADGTSITFGTTNISFGKANMRTYRGYSGPDANAGAHTASAVSSLQVAALSATVQGNEVYVAQWSGNVATVTDLRISDLGDVVNDALQENTWSGDKIVGAQGAVPGAETLTLQGSSTNNLTVIAVTLIPLPALPLPVFSHRHRTQLPHPRVRALRPIRFRPQWKLPLSPFPNFPQQLRHQQQRHKILKVKAKKPLRTRWINERLVTAPYDFPEIIRRRQQKHRIPKVPRTKLNKNKIELTIPQAPPKVAPAPIFARKQRRQVPVVKAKKPVRNRLIDQRLVTAPYDFPEVIRRKAQPRRTVRVRSKSPRRGNIELTIPRPQPARQPVPLPIAIRHRQRKRVPFVGKRSSLMMIMGRAAAVVVGTVAIVVWRHRAGMQ